MQVWCDWQVTLCDPHLSALEVRFSRRCAIQIDVYLYLYLTCVIGIIPDYTALNANSSVKVVNSKTYTSGRMCVQSLHWNWIWIITKHGKLDFMVKCGNTIL